MKFTIGSFGLLFVLLVTIEVSAQTTTIDFNDEKVGEAPTGFSTALTGKGDQGAGIVWRYQNKDNYYIVRANALEGNVVLYKVENGRRTDLPLVGKGRTYGMKERVPSGEWGDLRVVAKGSYFEVYHNDKKLYEVEDETFKEAGKVGVWTKADSVIYFDDLQITVK